MYLWKLSWHKQTIVYKTPVGPKIVSLEPGEERFTSIKCAYSRRDQLQEEYPNIRTRLVPDVELTPLQKRRRDKLYGKTGR